MIKLWVDFNNSTDSGVRLTCKGTIEDISRQKIALEDGLELLLWDEDKNEDGSSDNLIVRAIAHYNDKQNIWEALFNFADLKHESDLVQ